MLMDVRRRGQSTVLEGMRFGKKLSWMELKPYNLVYFGQTWDLPAQVWKFQFK